MSKTNFNLEEVKRMYLYENKTLSEIGSVIGLAPETVKYHLKKNSIKRLYKDEKWLYERRVLESMTTTEIASIINCNPRTIYQNLMDFNITQDPSSVRIKKVLYDTTYFSVIGTKEKAYWLGFIFADGGLSYSEGQYRLRFQLQQRDREHLQKLSDTVAKGSLIRDGETYDKRTEKTYRHSTLKIYSKVIVEQLINQGMIPGKKMDIDFPLIDKSFYSHFLRGLFDADGSFYIDYANTGNPNASFNLVGSKGIITRFSEIIETSLGITTKVKFERNMHMINIGGNLQILKLMEWIYKDSTEKLARKHSKWSQFCLERDNYLNKGKI